MNFKWLNFKNFSFKNISFNNINKDKVSYQGMLLGSIAGLSTMVLLLLHSFTAETIELRLREDQMAGLDQVLPASSYQNDLLATLQQMLINEQNYTVFTGKDSEGMITGYAVQTDAKGFSGPITLLMGVDKDLNILGLRVLAHTETPGLGDKIEIARSDWVRSFERLSLANTSHSNWAVKKDGGQFDQFTGATITPRAIVKQVHQSLLMLQSEVAKQKSIHPEVNSEVEGEVNE
ncbi:MAG: electron transport complex subunit RsxG [Colwellia sp.]